MDVQTVVFDLDGTLIDSFPGGFRNCCIVAGRLGWPAPDEARLCRLWGVDPDTILQTLYPGRDPAVFRYVWRLVEPDGVAPPPAFPGTLAAIRELTAAGLSLCIHTNRSADDQAAQRLADAQLDPTDFLFLQTRPEGAPAKPDPRALRAVLERLQVPPHQAHRVLVVSDRRDDGEMAHACGCRFVGVLSGAHTAEDFAPLAERGAIAALIPSVADLPLLLAHL